ncbi:MAG: type 4a pilus biogenesis protein PilO [Candidatus Hydrogenedentes bacterium]|nr:type 4a pilus biogenesis protein PilO [Candidatus Hydrogenedentota bacterium]
MMDMLKGKITLQDWIFVGSVLAVTAGLFVAFFFLVYAGQQLAVADRTKAYDSVTAELLKAQEIDANIDALRENAEKMNDLVSLFEQRLPEKREIPALLRGIERRAKELGLRMQLSSESTRRQANIEVIPYEVTAVGKFHEIITFINMLERDERYFKISEIDIGEEEEGVSEVVFVLSTFRFIQEELGDM